MVIAIVPNIFMHYPAQCSHSNVFVLSSDSQSSHMALAASSHWDYHHSCTGHTHLQWIPSHVGIEPNEQIDDIVGNYSNNFACTMMQREQPIELKAIKSSVKRRLRMKWITG